MKVLLDIFLRSDLPSSASSIGVALEDLVKQKVRRYQFLEYLQSEKTPAQSVIFRIHAHLSDNMPFKQRRVRRLLLAGIIFILGSVVGGFLFSFGTDVYNATKAILVTVGPIALTVPQIAFICLGVTGGLLDGYAISLLFKHKGPRRASSARRELIQAKPEDVAAYLFFPAGTPKENMTLDYHKSHFKHRVIVNFKTTPNEVFYLTTDSFGWNLISQFSDLWIAQTDSDPYSDKFVQKWCDTQGYLLRPRNATQSDLIRKGDG